MNLYNQNYQDYLDKIKFKPFQETEITLLGYQLKEDIGEYFIKDKNVLKGLYEEFNELVSCESKNPSLRKLNEEIGKLVEKELEAARREIRIVANKD